jgi:type IX secretion system PorP/SprF family membrane protein
MRYLLFIILCLGFKTAIAQDPLFTQNFMMPETISSSFTGSAETFKAGGIYRNQWRGLAFNTSTTFAFFDTYIEKFRSGVGISILQQKENETNYRFTQVNANYALKIRLNDDWYFRPSISVGFGMKDYAFDNLLLEDQININNGVIDPISIDPLLLQEKRSFVDFSSSILFNNEFSWIGITVKHLNKPNISLTEGGEVPLDIFLSIHTSYSIPIFTYNKNQDDHNLFILANYMHQNKYSRLDIGGQYTYNNQFSIGATASTNPLKATSESPILTSINPFLGLRWKEFKFGISYDINTTNIGNTGGVFEFLLTYEFNGFLSEGKLRCRPRYF